MVGNEEKAVVDALNALRHRYTYVFTTGGSRRALFNSLETHHRRPLASREVSPGGRGIEENSQGAETRARRRLEKVTQEPPGSRVGIGIGNSIQLPHVPSVMELRDRSAYRAMFLPDLQFSASDPSHGSPRDVSAVNYLLLR